MGFSTVVGTPKGPFSCPRTHPCPNGLPGPVVTSPKSVLEPEIFVFRQPPSLLFSPLIRTSPRRDPDRLGSDPWTHLSEHVSISMFGSIVSTCADGGCRGTGESESVTGCGPETNGEDGSVTLETGVPCGGEGLRPTRGGPGLVGGRDRVGRRRERGPRQERDSRRGRVGVR